MNTPLSMKQKNFFTLLAIVTLAILWRLIFIFHLKNDFIFYLLPGSDSAHYNLWAKTILLQGLFYKPIFYGMPLYAYFLSFVYNFFFMNLWAVRIIQLLTGITNCLLVFLIAKKLFDFKVAVLSAILMSGYLMFVFYELLIMPTTLIIFLNLLAILLFLELEFAPSAKNFFLFGVILGIVSLAEPGIILFCVGIIIWYLLVSKNATKKLLAKRCLVLMLGLVFVLCLNGLRNYITNKNFILVSAHSGLNFYIGNNPQASGRGDMPSFLSPSQKGHLEDARLFAEISTKCRLKPTEVSDFWFQKSINFIKQQPTAYISLMFKKLKIFWQRFEPVDTVEFTFLENDKLVSFLLLNSFGLIAPLGLLGIFLSLVNYRKIFVLYIFIFTQMLSVVAFFVTSRYRLLVVPVIIIFCAYCLIWFYSQVKQKQSRNFLYGFLGFIVLFGLVNYKNPDYKSVSFNSEFSKHYNLGIINLEKERFKEAIVELKLALKLNPGDYLSYFALGNAYYFNQEKERAIKEYKAALLINPLFIDAHFNLGNLYKDIGNIKEAEKEYKQVINLSPDSLDAYYGLATIYKSSKQYKQAITYFKKILEYNPYYNSSIKPLIEECEQLESRH